MRDCDFIPADRHESRSLKRAIHRRISLVSGLLVMMTVWFVAHQRQVSSAQAMINDVARQDEQLKIHAAKKASMEVEQARLEERHALVEQVSSRTHLAVVFADLSRRLPETMVLTQLSVRAPGLAQFITAAAAPAIPGTPANGIIELRGPGSNGMAQVGVPPGAAQLSLIGIARSAQDVIDFAAAMEGSPLYDRIQIDSQGATKWAGRRAERFVVTCNLVEQKGDRS